MEIRTGRRSDAAQVAALHAESWRTAYAGIMSAGEMAGFAYLMPRPDGRLLLDNLHARRGRTGTGIGGRLLRHAFTWAAEEHPGKAVYLEVLRANTPAIAFYERHGALRTDERVCRFEQGFELPEL